MQMRFLVSLFISLSLLAAKEPLQSMILTFCNASLLRVKDLLSRFYLDGKVSLLIASLPDIPRLNIDKYYHGSEALHGIVWPGKCTIFLQAIALAITCNPEPHNVLRPNCMKHKPAGMNWNRVKSSCWVLKALILL